MRGQSAVEFFLVASTLVLMFTWLANYAEVFYAGTASDSLFFQEKEIADRVATLSSSVCFTNVSYNTTIGCPVYRGKPSPIILSVIQGSNAVNVSSFINVSNASSTQACTFGGSFSTFLLCSNASYGELCIRRASNADAVNITLGGCA